MSDIIKLLPEHVANQIAAGEVIQRPASVVKELLDNSIDAESTEIKLIVKEAGKALIQLIDNGKGMSPTDARMCWERHATSKINSIEDVFKIKTMGFRGEALASIASVAKVELKSKRQEDSIGTYILIEGSNVLKQEAAATNIGTSVSVKNLFFNIPARRNFLKSNPVEFRHIVDEFTRAALANPQINFELWHNDDEIFKLKSSDLAYRICDIFSDKKPEQLLHFEEETTIMNVSGFIGIPAIAKKTRGEQLIFVNKRYIKDAYLNHAIISGFENIISKEQFPFYCIQIEIDPSQIDVNIHPTKTEIKFEDEKNIYQILRAVSRKSLGGFYTAPAMHDAFDDNNFMHVELRKGAAQNQQDLQTVKNFNSNTFLTDEYSQYRNANKQEKQNWEELFKIARNTNSQQKSQLNAESDFPIQQQLSVQNEKSSQSFFQLHQTYIVTQIKSGLLVIDQQAAHERILFEKYLIAMQRQGIASQQKLFPKVMTLNTADELILQEILPQIRLLGFDINEFGKNTFVVNGVPAELHHSNEQKLIEEMILNFKNNKNQAENRNETIALSLASQAAIKSGTKLTTDEMNQLLDELFACNEPKYSPAGKACILTLSLDQLSTMFKPQR